MTVCLRTPGVRAKITTEAKEKTDRSSDLLRTAGTTSNSKADGRIGKQDFVYVPEKNEYRCPAVQSLIYRYTNLEAGLTTHAYWTSNCQQCASADGEVTLPRKDSQLPSDAFASRAWDSRFPIALNATMAGICTARGLDLPDSQLRTDWPATPRSSPQSFDDSSSRCRWEAKPFALKRTELASSAGARAGGAALFSRRTSCSSACMRRFRADSSARCVPAPFLRAAVSLRITLRVTRATSSLKTVAMFGIGAIVPRGKQVTTGERRVRGKSARLQPRHRCRVSCSLGRHQDRDQATRNLTRGYRQSASFRPW